ncbi:MAG: diguanylate cyclase [Polyangiaceae bacterium]
MSELAHRIVLIDPCEPTREALARRLRFQGYTVETAPDANVGAELALFSPPSALVADLWMPGISGVQLCRLLRSEPATSDVQVILRGEADEPRARFWAERAGASAYVAKARMGELVRALARALPDAPSGDGFFMHLGQENSDLRDRIAQHLDAALFELVIASELRALSSCGSFELLFDRLSQLLSQIVPYRWLALARITPEQVALHCHPDSTPMAASAAGHALQLAPGESWLRLEDEDAQRWLESDAEMAPIMEQVSLVNTPIARVALAPLPCAEREARSLLAIVARELAAPLRMAELVEQSQRLACVDGLTGLLNRRALSGALSTEVARGQRYGHSLSLVMVDVDHFKSVNDRFGHATGDEVLRAVSAALDKARRRSDLAGRWGGEEFVVALSCTDAPGAAIAAERLRRAVAAEVIAVAGEELRVTASFGVATLGAGETWDSCLARADHALYAAKSGGRNRVVSAEGAVSAAPRASEASRPAADDAVRA